MATKLVQLENDRLYLGQVEAAAPAIGAHFQSTISEPIFYRRKKSTALNRFAQARLPSPSCAVCTNSNEKVASSR